MIVTGATDVIGAVIVKSVRMGFGGCLYKDKIPTGRT